MNKITAVLLSGLDTSCAHAAGLTQDLLHLSLDKGSDIRCSNWEVCPLSAQQKAYAANDAYAAIKVYQVCRPWVKFAIFLDSWKCRPRYWNIPTCSTEKPLHVGDSHTLQSLLMHCEPQHTSQGNVCHQVPWWCCCIPVVLHLLPQLMWSIINAKV